MLAMILITVVLFSIFGISLISSGAIDAALLSFPIMLIVIFIVLPNFFLYDEDDESEKKDLECTIEWEENDDDE